MTEDDPRHGTPAGYWRHRRLGESACEDCAHAHYLYGTRYYAERSRGHRRTTNPTPAINHINYLREQGMTLGAIIGAAGIGRSNVYAVVNGERKSLHVDTIRKILAVHPPTTGIVTYENALIPATGARRRIRALLAIGWTHAILREKTGCLTGQVLSRTTLRINSSQHRRIAETYDELHLTQGPSQINRDRATKFGWLPPLSYDNIDDPHETPTPSTSTSASYVDPVVVERLLRGENIYATTAEEEEAVLRIMANPEKTLAEFAQISHLRVHSIAERLYTRARRAA